MHDKYEDGDILLIFNDDKFNFDLLILIIILIKKKAEKRGF